jgi:hypothetical protein
MVATEIEEDEIRPILVNASELDDKQTQWALTWGMIQAKKDLLHPLAPVAVQILNKWLDAGFIASPAGAMISAVGYDRTGQPNISEPEAALIDGNGVPVVVVIGEIEAGRIELRMTFDHRCLDPHQGGKLHRWMMAEVPKEIQKGTA